MEKRAAGEEPKEATTRMLIDVHAFASIAAIRAMPRESTRSLSHAFTLWAQGTHPVASTGGRR